MPGTLEGSEFWYLTNLGQIRLEKLDMLNAEGNIDYRILNYMRSGESKNVDEIADFLGLKPVVVVGMLRSMAELPHGWVIKESRYDLIAKELAPYWDEDTSPVNPKFSEGLAKLGGELRPYHEIPYEQLSEVDESEEN